jgi:hypothetical protein
MTRSATAVGGHRAPEDALETIASLADVDRTGRHAAPEGDEPIYEALRAELAAVDWFSLG